MVREERAVEVTLISATDLKKVKKFGGEQKCYVVAYIYPARKQTTGVDPYGGVNPMWNATVKLACYETDVHPDDAGAPAAAAHMVTVEIYSHGGGIFHKSDKLVGTVAVPLQRVVSAAKAGGVLPAFEVHLPSGEVQGSLNLSVKLGAKRELGDYEDLSAALLPSYSDEQEPPSPNYPPASGKVPSTTQPGSSYATQGQSSYGNYPPTSAHPTASSSSPSPNKNASAAEGQASYGNYQPNQTSSTTAGPSSYGNSYPPAGAYPPTAPNTNAFPAQDDVVTGYPAPEYAFAPLGQLPTQRPGQPGTSGQGPFGTFSSEGMVYQTRRDRKRARKEQKRARRGGRRGGPIHLGIMVLHGIFAPVTTAIGHRMRPEAAMWRTFLHPRPQANLEKRKALATDQAKATFEEKL